MEKRTVLAVVLSSAVLILWSLLSHKPPHSVDVQMPPSVSEPSAPAKLPQAADRPIIATEKKPESLINYSTENFDVVFNESQAAIQDIIFKKYDSYKFSLLNGLILNGNEGFKKDAVTPDTVSFVYLDVNKKITKLFKFDNSRYYIELEINVQNLSNKPLNGSFPLALGTLDFSIAQDQAHFQDVTVSTAEKYLRPNAQKEQVFNNLKFIGLRNKYFCAILEPPTDQYKAYISKDDKKSIIGVEPQPQIVPPGESYQQLFHIYIGPQQSKLISAIKSEWSGVLHYGTFDIIAQVLLGILDVLHNLFKNWGLAIIILSALIYFIFYPLSIKQMRSMKEMQALQPRIEELRKTYKDNPQKFNKEMMQLYKEHKVNPFAGCLPLILQMPIFFALYQALMRSIFLKGARFLWIKDLSEPDRIINLPMTLPVIRNEVNLLPILMMIGMFVQQKMSMSTSAGVSNEQQKIMLIIMPLMFGVIFYHMPAGLVLYWFINSLLMLVYQLKSLNAK